MPPIGTDLIRPDLSHPFNPWSMADLHRPRIKQMPRIGADLIRPDLSHPFNPWSIPTIHKIQWDQEI